MASGASSGGHGLADPRRLAALARSELMDSGPEEVFDRLTRVAARVLGTPLAFLTLLDEHRQFFKSRFGLDEDAVPLPAAESYCQYVVNGAAPLVVEDLRRDERIADPSRLLADGLLAYCGVPLTDSDGNTLGTLCTIDEAPHRWSADDVELLTELAAGAMAQIELRLASRELRAHEQEWRAVVDGMHEAFVGCDAAGTIVRWNPAAERMLGFSEREVIGTPVIDLLLPGDRRERAQAILAGTSDQADGMQTETYVRHRSGETVHVELSLSVVDLPRGRRMNVICCDVTEQRRLITLEREARAAQRAVEQRHGRVLSTLPDAMVILYDTELRLQLIQGGLVAELGIDPAALEGRSLHDLVTNDRQRLLMELVGRALAGESTSIDLDMREDASSPLDHIFQIEFAPYYGDDGEIIGGFTVWRDVTHRILREEENRMLATMVQQSSDAIEAKDLDGVVTEWSGAAERLYGYTREEALGQPTGELILPPECRQEEAEAMARARAGKSTQVDTVRRHKNGELVHVSLSQSPIHDGAGQIVGVAVIARDIAERKRFEDQLRHLADHDPLTGLFNRRRFEQELARTISFVDRYATPSALLLIDLDGFKNVNDTLGHACGDEILTRVATALSSATRETDVVGRLGGDEFAVIAGSVGAAEAQIVAQKVLAAVREHGVVSSEDGRAAVSASIGVTVLDHENRLDGEALLARADAAMYAAKQHGRNRIAFSGPAAPPS